MDHNEFLPSAEGAVPISSFMRLPAVLQATGLARSTVYRMVAERTFPAPVKLAKRAVGWRQNDVRQWSETRPSRHDDGIGWLPFVVLNRFICSHHGRRPSRADDHRPARSRSGASRHAKARRLTLAAAARSALAAALQDAPPADASEADLEQDPAADRSTKLTLRLRRGAADRLAIRARAAGLPYGAYVATLLDGTPVPPPLPTTRRR